MNELQSTLDFPDHIEFINSSNNEKENSFINTSLTENSSKASTQSPQPNFERKNLDEMDAIDQQFDEVLKFLAQSIDDHGSPVLSSTSLSSISLSATHNSDNNSETDIANSKASIKSEAKSEISSKSSGIGDEIYETSNTESPIIMSETVKIAQNQPSFNSVSMNENINLLIKQQKAIDRNSSDSAYTDALPITTSLSLGIINNSASQSKNQSSISNPIFLQNNNTNTSQSNSSDQSPNSQTVSLNSVSQSSVKTVRK